VKTNGSSNPCTKRHSTSACRSGAAATSNVGTTMAKAAPTISRQRPSRSEIVPTKGATPATASKGAVMASPVLATLTARSRAISGRMACGV
jgi:hypothetical protein